MKIFLFYLITLLIYSETNSQNIVLFRKCNENNISECNLKHLRGNDSFSYDSIKFYKVEKSNIHNYLTDSNTLILHYSSWCSGLKFIPEYIKELKTKNPYYKIYLLDTDMTSLIISKTTYLKENELNNDILFIDYDEYKKGNWAVKFDNFLEDICSSCLVENTNTTRYVLQKDKKGNIIYHD